MLTSTSWARQALTCCTRQVAPGQSQDIQYGSVLVSPKRIKPPKSLHSGCNKCRHLCRHFNNM
jgi:hypothetical protein